MKTYGAGLLSSPVCANLPLDRYPMRRKDEEYSSAVGAVRKEELEDFEILVAGISGRSLAIDIGVDSSESGSSCLSAPLLF